MTGEKKKPSSCQESSSQAAPRAWLCQQKASVRLPSHSEVVERWISAPAQCAGFRWGRDPFLHSRWHGPIWDFCWKQRDVFLISCTKNPVQAGLARRRCFFCFSHCPGTWLCVAGIARRSLLYAWLNQEQASPVPGKAASVLQGDNCTLLCPSPVEKPCTMPRPSMSPCKGWSPHPHPGGLGGKTKSKHRVFSQQRKAVQRHP